jgi:hypothetical protein
MEFVDLKVIETILHNLFINKRLTKWSQWNLNPRPLACHAQSGARFAEE